MKTTTGSQKANTKLPGHWTRHWDVPELQAEQVIQQQASQGGETASVLRATQALYQPSAPQARPPPPPSAPPPEPQGPSSSSASASASASAASQGATWINVLGSWITRDEANKKATADQMSQLFTDPGNVLPMEVEDLAQLTSNPSQKRSMEDDPNSEVQKNQRADRNQCRKHPRNYNHHHHHKDHQHHHLRLRLR